MDFQVFKNLRAEHVEWMAVNGYNEGDCNKNGEFFRLMPLPLTLIYLLI